MLIIGLTGSIATGKSTVSALLRLPPYSLPIIDADVLARQVVEPGTSAYREVVRVFGDTTPDLLLDVEGQDGDGKDKDRRDGGKDSKGRPLNRAALGRRVFGSSPSATRDRKLLSSILHPAIRRSIYRSLAYYYLNAYPFVILDVPLLFESGLDVLCGVVIVVAVSEPEVQLRRLLERDRDGKGEMTEEEARQRISSQVGIGEKVERVSERGKGWGEVVWNDGGREELERGLGEVMGRVLGGGGNGRRRLWAWCLLGCPPLAVVVGAWCVVWGWWAGRRWERERERRGKAKL